MNIFLRRSSLELKRLLSQVDTNYLSPTFGNFDRSYWHYRTKEFPSSSLQQSILSIAILLKNNFEGNFLYQREFYKDLFNASLREMAKMQKEDGSFDEWYYNERGWAGPTGYNIYALAKCYSDFKEFIDPDSLIAIEKTLVKSCDFLDKGWEKDILANHIAIANLALFETAFALNSDKYEMCARRLLEKFSNYWNDSEGWSLEYDGADIGYQSATASFYSRVYEKFPIKEIENICVKSLELCSYFAYPDNSFAGFLGSRQTEIPFHYACEFWKNKSPIAASLRDFFIKGLESGGIISLGDQDDHYLTYRFIEYLETGLEYRNVSFDKNIKKEELPFNKENFTKYLPQSGFFLKKENDFYFVSNLKRGGVYKSFSIKEKKLKKSNAGIFFEKKHRLYSTQWMNEKSKINIEEDKLSIETNFFSINKPVFNFSKSILFKIIMKLSFNYHISYILKWIIRNILITRSAKSSVKLQRSFQFYDEGGDLNDIVKGSSVRKGDLFYSFSHRLSRVVPQTGYATGLEIQSYKKIEALHNAEVNLLSEKLS